MKGVTEKEEADEKRGGKNPKRRRRGTLVTDHRDFGVRERRMNGAKPRPANGAGWPAQLRGG